MNFMLKTKTKGCFRVLHRNVATTQKLKIYEAAMFRKRIIWTWRHVHTDEEIASSIKMRIYEAEFTVGIEMAINEHRAIAVSGNLG